MNIGINGRIYTPGTQRLVVSKSSMCLVDFDCQIIPLKQKNAQGAQGQSKVGRNISGRRHGADLRPG